MKYSEEDRLRALEVYKETKSVTETMRILGLDMSRGGFYEWLKKAGIPVKKAKPCPSLETKLNAVYRCFKLGESVQSVAREIGFSARSIYVWGRKYLEGGDGMRKDKRAQAAKSGKGSEQEIETEKDKRIAELEAQLEEMQFELDVSNATLDVVLKKYEGASKTLRKAETKTAIARALKDKHSLPKLRKKLKLAKSTYYYHEDEERLAKKKKKEEERQSLVQAIFMSSNEIYGYRRIWACLVREGHVIAEKAIRRIMKELGLKVRCRRARKYSSYKGEITPPAPNVIARDFHADRPNEKWLTDITEFPHHDSKVYLSLLMDCFDGMPVAWTVGTSPTAELANTMLKKGVATLHEGEHPILHSDRGCHYRWPEWIRIEEEAGIIRSMSKKGCSPDNAACEGFFGRMKLEMFYDRDWSGVSLDEFMEAIDDYLVWFCCGRIKAGLGNKTPMEYRQSLGFVV